MTDATTRHDLPRRPSTRIPQVTVLGVIGLNGAGKSTLLRATAPHLPPDRRNTHNDKRLTK